METVAIDWSYAISTLIIRFVGIFVVLGFLQVIMQITGRIFITWDEKDKVKTPDTTKADTGEISPDQVAAIGMALYLHERNR